MSGGTDSSVAAILLKQMNFDIQGLTFEMWKPGFSSNNTETTLQEAKALAKKLNFKHSVIDIRDKFEHYVVQNFVSEYLNAKTPNPCVVCNSYIKWGIMLEEMKKHGCNYYATGHYARVREENERFILMKGADVKKDQSYFLWTLTQEQLKHTVFPLGELIKEQVREIARENGFESVADKAESQEICFIEDNNYRNFLSHYVENINAKVKPGNIIDKNGKILGQHKGYPFYTIGQRRGLDVALGKPAYVIAIDSEKNEIQLGDYSDLERTQVRLKQTNWIKYEQPPENLEIEAKIRYKSPAVPGSIRKDEKGYYLDLYQPVYAVTPGQSCVIYEGDDVIGGGIILE